jgi:hypothetical protein
MFNFLNAFRNGKLTEGDIINEMVTELGGSLYAYMVMLEGQERKVEAERMKDLRTRIFSVRTKLKGYALTDIEKELDPVLEMQKIALELGVVASMLSIYRPNEAIIFQTPTDNAIGLTWSIKEYLEKQ